MKSRKKTVRRGFNTCESCHARLVRDPQQSWRYSSVCPGCGLVQSWGTHTSGSTNVGETPPDHRV